MDEKARGKGCGGLRQDAVMVSYVRRNGLATDLDLTSIPGVPGRTAAVRNPEKAYAIAGSGCIENIALVPGIGGAAPVSNLQQRRASMRARA